MHLPAILGSWGLPPDGPAWGAFAVAVAAIVVACAREDLLHVEVPRGLFPDRTRSRVFLAVTAFGAALLSLGYIAFYLRDGPRIVDATTYFLQARALSQGHFAWHVPEPTASFRGRFLVGHDGQLAGIFPPGYPLLLSLGFAVGAPLVVGPLLAGAIVMATWGLARELAREAGMDAHGVESVARLAACLSVACAALRYHTADTMAHGACALAFALAMLAALRARRGAASGAELPWFFLLAGLALGFVMATRFASALALGSVLVCLALTGKVKTTSLVACAIGAVPGLLLLLISEGIATGHAFGSTQSAYYAASDGPPGCFRYGFGTGIGCLVEHGDFVRARMTQTGQSYGLLAALGVTARRLRMHTEDVANFEPIALFVLAPLFRLRTATRGERACLGLVGALVLAYAPFYFDGDYPGGGARFFADALPIEHALIAMSLAIAVGGSWRRGLPVRAAAPIVALCALGFSVHAAFDHEQLRARDGGHPMFDPEVFANRSLGAAAKDGVAASLVFFETDHGFDLAHDPDAADRTARALAVGGGQKASGTIVARLRGDDHDRLLYERLGRPPAWVYHFIPESSKTRAPGTRGRHALDGDLQPWSSPATWRPGGESWRFEAEAEWPPLAQTGNAWAEPIWATNSCASPSTTGRALALHSSGKRGGTVVLALPIPRPTTWRVTPRFLVERGDARSPGVGIDVIAADGAVLAHWDPSETSTDALGDGTTCFDAPAKVITATSDHELRLTLTPPRDAAHLVALDKVTVAPAH